jgi:nitroreductase
MSLVHQVLDVARWAPSGDNTQPWRFEILSDTEALVHAHDTRAHCVYDLDGHASEVAHGALLENIALAATRFGARARDAVVADDAAGRTVYRIVLERAEGEAEDPLARYIECRTVERRAMRRTPLEPAQRAALADAARGFELVLFEGGGVRRETAALNASNAGIRLTIPEAYAVHKAVIAWDSTTSDDRLPDASLGAGPILLATMRFAMASWPRVHFLNRAAGGTLLPRLMLDVIPGVFCSAHFALIAPTEPVRASDHVAAGRAMQRLWLAATGAGLALQPSYTPLVFARYAREKRRFTSMPDAARAAGRVAQRLDQLLGADKAARAVFMGRLGPARARAAGRSLRLPLERLIVTDRSAGGASVVR